MRFLLLSLMLTSCEPLYAFSAHDAWYLSQKSLEAKCATKLSSVFLKIQNAAAAGNFYLSVKNGEISGCKDVLRVAGYKINWYSNVPDEFAEINWVQ